MSVEEGLMSMRSKKSEDTIKKIHRLLSILRKLDIRKPCTPASLAREYGTTTRNVYRDIADLNAVGFSITFERKAGTYRFTDPGYTLRDLNLNEDEHCLFEEVPLQNRIQKARA